MENQYLICPGSYSVSSILEGVADNPKLMEFVIKTMSKIFNYELNPEQKALVVKSIHKVAENSQVMTMLDCYEEWNNYPTLDDWNAYTQKYFLF